MAISISGTTLTFNDNTTMTTASNGTVTSVATGNGLSGGTITTTGTLTLAAPSANTVGSWIFGRLGAYTTQGTITYGNNYAIGTGNFQVQWTGGGTTGLTGTWKYCGVTQFLDSGDTTAMFCKVS